MSECHPRPVRLEAVEHCTIVREDGSLICGILVNLSDEGFCIETSDGLELGERVQMRVVGLGCIAGLVRWLDRRRAGGVLEPYSRGACEASS